MVFYGLRKPCAVNEVPEVRKEVGMLHHIVTDRAVGFEGALVGHLASCRVELGIREIADADCRDGVSPLEVVE